MANEHADPIATSPAPHTPESVRGIVPALPGRETVDFEDEIEEAMQFEADRIVARLAGRSLFSTSITSSP